MDIQHSPECINRARAVSAWHAQWPNAHVRCAAQGAIEYPATREDPGDIEVCTCQVAGLCPRCMHTMLSNRKEPMIGWWIYERLERRHVAMKRKYGVEHYELRNRDNYFKYSFWWYRPIYLPVNRLCAFLFSFAPEIKDDKHPCVHCGWNHGHKDGDYMPEDECYCMEVE